MFARPKEWFFKKNWSTKEGELNCLDVKLDSCELCECFCSLQCIKIAVCVHSRTHCKIARSLIIFDNLCK